MPGSTQALAPALFKLAANQAKYIRVNDLEHNPRTVRCLPLGYYTGRPRRHRDWRMLIAAGSALAGMAALMAIIRLVN